MGPVPVSGFLSAGINRLFSCVGGVMCGWGALIGLLCGCLGGGVLFLGCWFCCVLEGVDGVQAGGGACVVFGLCLSSCLCGVL